MFKTYPFLLPWPPILLAFCFQLLEIRASAQTVDLELKNVPIQKLFSEIFHQTGVSVIYPDNLFRHLPPISIQAKKASIQEVLSQCLDSRQFNYVLDRGVIFISSKNAPGHFKPTEPSHQNEILRGTVKDLEGATIFGATISVINDRGVIKHITSSDPHGAFSLTQPDKPAQIQVTMIGYEPQALATNGQTVLNVILEQKATLLEDVAIETGYLKKTNRELTGSAQSLSSAALNNGVTSVDGFALLKGRLAGLYIMANGGDPNQKSAVVQRGYSAFSISGNRANAESAPTLDGDATAQFGPLLVIDGMITNARNISDLVNIADVESITQLKDAAATSIYGSRGAQGVLVIQTKKGRSRVPQVQLQVKAGISAQPPMPTRMLTTPEFIEMVQSALSTTYFRNLEALQETYPRLQDYLKDRLVLSEEQKNTQTNWDKWAFRKGRLLEANASVAGGGNLIRYYLGLGYYKEIGNQLATSLDRKTFRLNVDVDFSKKITLGIGVGSIFESGLQPNFMEGSFGSFALPYLNPHQPDGGLSKSFRFQTLGGYPFEVSNFLFENQFNNTKLGFISHEIRGMVQYKPLSWVSLKSIHTLRPSASEYNSFIDPRSFEGNPQSISSPNGGLIERNSKSLRYMTSNQLELTRVIGAHHLTGLLGQEYYKDDIVNTSAMAYGLPPGARYLSSARFLGNPGFMGVPPVTEEPFSRAGFSVFSEMDYDFQQKYLFTGTFRTDASTNFGKKNRYGKFYSISGAWVISKEPFFNGLENIQNFKIRTSYGTSGKEAGADFLNYTFYKLFPAGYHNQPSAYPIQKSNPDITWETTTTLNLGVDLNVANRFSLSVDQYYRTTKNIIQFIPVSSFMGIGNQFRNVAELSNVGTECMLQTIQIKGKRFQWETQFNISFNKNKIKKIYGDQYSVKSASGTAFYNLYPGDDIAAIKAITYKGVDAQTGLPIFEGKEANGNPFTAHSIREVMAGSPDPFWVLGSSTPKFFGGLNNTFRLQDFTLSILTSFAYGMYGKNMAKYWNVFPYYHALMNFMKPPNGMNIWLKPGDKAKLPVMDLLDDRGVGDEASSFLYDDLSHLRIQNVRLDYQFQPQWLPRGLTGFRFFISADNAYVFKKPSFFGSDPEGSSLKSADVNGAMGPGMYGQPRKWIVGFSATF